MKVNQIYNGITSAQLTENKKYFRL